MEEYILESARPEDETQQEKQATEIQEKTEDRQIEENKQPILMSKNLKANWIDLKTTLMSKIERYQIEEDIEGYFTMQHTLAPQLVQAIIKDYKRYLVLHFIAISQESFIPSQMVKKFWDSHIAQTAYYRRFCYEVFGCFLHSQHYPRQADLDQRQKYIDTILSYKEVFGEYPASQIWPDPQTQFDYEVFYSNKYFNIYGYMYEVFNKLEKKQIQQELNNQQEVLERQMSLGAMRVTENPTRGRQFISINLNKAKS